MKNYLKSVHNVKPLKTRNLKINNYLFAERGLVDLKVEEDSNVSDLEELYERYSDSIEIECKNSKRLGHKNEGGWSLCFDGNFKLPSNTKPSISPCSCHITCPCKPTCLVYSFGIKDDWSFDDDIVNEYDCLLRAFDPSLNKSTAIRNDRIQFERIGLAGQNRVTIDVNKWKMSTLGELLKDRNETETLIDYLKIDIEYWEWESLQTAIDKDALKNVKQLGVEFHRDELMSISTSLSHYKKFLKVFKSLREAGFYKWYSHLNPSSYVVYSLASYRNVYCCHEFVYLNLNF